MHHFIEHALHTFDLFVHCLFLFPFTTLAHMCVCMLVVEGEVSEVLGQFNTKVVITEEQPFFSDVKDLIIQSQTVRTPLVGYRMWLCF